MIALLTCIAALAIIPIASALPSPSPKPSFKWKDTKHLIAFGDSYTYVQGTHGHQNYSFIGDLQNLNFSASTLLSNRIVQNQTATAEGGPNWVEYLTGCGLRPGLTDPRSCDIQLWDFAFAGSDISEEFTPLHHNFTVSLVNAVEQFKTYGQPVLKQFVDPSKALVAVWIGINDINDSDKYNVTFPSFYNQLLDTLFSSVESIFELGYKDFLFLNLPPLDRTQANLRAADPLPNKTMIGWWNEALEKHARAFQTARQDTEVRARVFDANSFLNSVLDEPWKYGITNVTNYCPSYNQPFIDSHPEWYGCLPLDQYFWFNSGHMTSHVHELLSGAVREFLEDH